MLPFAVKYGVGMMLSKPASVLGLILIGSLSAGQDDPGKQRAIDQMRHIADAMKRCPEEKSSHQDECQVRIYHLGPTSNLEWDVLPSKSVRAPYLGVIEFTLPNRTETTDVANLSKKAQKRCQDQKSLIASVEAETLSRDMREGPMWREGHYRFEFDVGSTKPELVKMLWIAKDRNNNVITSPANDGTACWIAKAKSGGDTE